MASPFLKWAGGKRELIEALDSRLPDRMRDGGIYRFVEPFVGGGALFFHIRRKYPIEEFHISDLNPDLVNSYLVVRDGLSSLLGHLGEIADEYLPLDHDGRSQVFYQVRESYNSSRGALVSESDTEERAIRAAQTIFLNRTCFNGLYRVNSNGEYNVPHGNYSNPHIRNSENLEKISVLLQDVEISCGSYEDCREHVDGGTFVYFDPPYRPLPNANSFTDYSQTSSFRDEDQRTLAEFFSKMHNRGASLMLSNSDPHVTNPNDDFFDEVYADFNIHRVKARRRINSDGSGRGAISEIIVTNY